LDGRRRREGRDADGETDEIGATVAEDQDHVHDLHVRLDHTRLTPLIDLYRCWKENDMDKSEGGQLSKFPRMAAGHWKCLPEG
jgi:hypothetical protein